VTRRVVAVALSAPAWSPPQIAPEEWRRALAEDAVDILASLAEADPAVVCRPEDRGLADAVIWPKMRVYEVPTLAVPAILAAVAADGYEQAAILSADAPDLPGMLIGKLLRPLTTRTVAVAPAVNGTGLLGLAARVPAPAWLPVLDLDSASAALLRTAAGKPAEVAVSPGWHRLRGPEDLHRLDPGLEGWEATRALLP
jgi:hypothetical protein